ncbi:hypothetical protein CC2G_009457 [Coprinopsis cinerea AmutBmut pab1-1]|nr:hypothetical protein CC2G_009457 [Coprinopsis cinerea AmutBmut pab1-1]
MLQQCCVALDLAPRIIDPFRISFLTGHVVHQATGHLVQCDLPTFRFRTITFTKDCSQQYQSTICKPQPEESSDKQSLHYLISLIQPFAAGEIHLGV